MIKLRNPAAFLLAAASIAGLLGPITAPDGSAVFAGLHNPLGGDLLPGWDDGPLFAGGFILASVTIIARWLRADGEQRRVLRWLAVVNAVVILLVPFVLSLPGGTVIGPLATVFELLVVIAVVLSNQIYGLDVVRCGATDGSGRLECASCGRLEHQRSLDCSKHVRR